MEQPPRPTRPWRPWLPSEDAFLVEQRVRGRNLRQIAADLGRNYTMVRSRARRLEAKGRRTPADDSLVTLAMRAGDLAWDLETLAALLARGGQGVSAEAASAWRGELIAMASRCHEVYCELARLRDREMER
jgi:hypothetical protein